MSILSTGRRRFGRRRSSGRYRKLGQTVKAPSESDSSKIKLPSPQSKIGTNIKKRVRGSTFGSTQVVEGVRNEISGSTKATQFGTQSVSTGGTRTGTGGIRRRRMSDARSSHRKSKYLIDKNSEGLMLRNRKRPLGGDSPVSKRNKKGPSVA